MSIPFLSQRGWLRYRSAPRRPGAHDLAIARNFLDPASGPEVRYEALFRYFVDGFLAAATPDFERAQYRGMGSRHGYRVAGVEGFARTAPLFAAWMAGGRGSTIEGLSSGRSADLAQILASGFSAGSDPAHPAYWSEVRDFSQVQVEASDIAIALWISRETIWPMLTARVQSNLLTWLRRAAVTEHPANNWLLFGATAEAVVAALEGRDLRSSANYQRFKQFYLGHGWFSDAEKRRVVDYYNVWGITYQLCFLHLMQPALDPAFIPGVVLQSADLTSHLISPRGVPIMGRSVCYRTAASAPLAVATLLDATPERLGLARHATDCVWRHFITNGALRDGTLTQGYHGDDPRVLDNYSGPGSSHWGLRSVIPALLHPRGSPYWTVPEQTLPVERGDYRLDLPELGWIIEGDHASGDVRVVIPDNAGRQPALKPYTLRHRLMEAYRQQAMRPNNHDAAYGAESYSALDPFPLKR
ncbi:MAG: hypothetical protein JWQ89_269 [Devosia sp.]|uniref:DUF2264 domain-containing protein n=1 Tax=Devosia sp. TaxID=1871048 RepID=UPI002614F982|nr:DUF2264 domain-containing protein [Devosia sp.]MDB5538542.1 hypothetical protein [Devosia sp.]